MLDTGTLDPESRQVLLESSSIYESMLKHHFNCTTSISQFFCLLAREDRSTSLRQVAGIQTYLRNRLILNTQSTGDTVQHTNIVMVLHLISDLLALPDTLQQMRL